MMVEVEKSFACGAYVPLCNGVMYPNPPPEPRTLYPILSH